MPPVEVLREPPLLIVTINRPEVRNAVDGPTAAALAAAFRDYEEDAELDVAILTGAGGTFCAGADLRAIAEGSERANRLSPDGDGPMGPSRMLLDKPVVAAIEGYAVAGGLELALWCDLRVMAEDAILGVYCRRWGVPLIDGGTVRLPLLVGHGRALDIILTGRDVAAEEALAIGLATRVAPSGRALDEARRLAQEIARFPQMCLRADRRSVYAQRGRSLEDALDLEFRGGVDVVASGETRAGAQRFIQGHRGSPA
jgi:enoyl-CoA hydratase